MTVYHIPLLALSEQETRRYAGLGGSASFPGELVASACGDGLLLAKPRATWKRYAYNRDRQIIHAPSPALISSRDVAAHLQAAVEVAVLAVTIGPQLEKEVTRRFAAGDYTAGLLLDAAGTTAVEQTADEACKYLAGEAARAGLGCTSRYSPGYGDWAVEEQPSVLTLADGAAIGITINESCILSPRKSITAVIGLAPAAGPTPAGACRSEGCASCRLPNCFARKEPRA
ncbi:MAG TPA: methionine synthase [Selenomonadales bacterium]|nr:methionine synthase [Selenomonadales bacterium]